MKIIDDWKKAWSVWLLGAAIGIAELAPYIPDLQEHLPADWYRAAFLIVLVARVIKQKAS